ncbi:MAG: M20/M25/M40 family metallo-hydrolase, partial [Caldilineaceae bacterium]
AGLEQPPVDIWLVANSNEEGLGDLKGIRAAVDRLEDSLGAVLVLEGMGLGRIVHAGLGVRRYRIHASAPGGHSWGDFGSASAIHSLAALVTDITRLNVPQQPRTSYNIGKFKGGTSVNTIAQHASLELDLRSVAPETLAQLVEQVQHLVQRHQRHHTKAQSGVAFSVETIGDRPAGQIPESHPLMQAASAVLAQLGIPEQMDVRISSTDANIPLSRGIPSVCIGLTEGGDAHRLSEWIDPRPLAKGIQQLLYLTWWTAAWLTTGG